MNPQWVLNIKIINKKKHYKIRLIFLQTSTLKIIIHYYIGIYGGMAYSLLHKVWSLEVGGCTVFVQRHTLLVSRKWAHIPPEKINSSNND